jgi:hypothetical protein
VKEELTNYLSSKNLEEHVSIIIDIVNKHYNKKTFPARAEKKLIKRRGTKENLYENQFYVIVKDFHTKDKVDIWVLKLKRKIWLKKDEFSELKEFIECYDGYYSGFSGGFIFESMPSEKIIEEATELIENLVE